MSIPKANTRKRRPGSLTLMWNESKALGLLEQWLRR